MRHIFIINPVAGQTDAMRQLWPGIQTAAARLGVPIEHVITDSPRHAVRLARQYAQTGKELRLYAVGGDGTLNEILEGAHACPNASIGCVPCGSGNDFVRAFGSQAPFLDIAAQFAGSVFPLDLIQTDSGICASITSTGLDADVAYAIPKYRRLPLLGGAMAYNISILEKLLHPLGKPVCISIDGKQHVGKYLIATVCNARHYGGGFNAAPEALLDDGVLDIILVKKISRLLIASIIGKYKKGQHIQNGAVVPSMQYCMQYQHGKEVTITPTGAKPLILNVDGECAPAARLYAKVLPLAARFIVPKGASLPGKTKNLL